jgi:hypothetical protein
MSATGTAVLLGLYVRAPALQELGFAPDVPAFTSAS